MCSTSFKTFGSGLDGSKPIEKISKLNRLIVLIATVPTLAPTIPTTPVTTFPKTLKPGTSSSIRMGYSFNLEISMNIA